LFTGRSFRPRAVRAAFLLGNHFEDALAIREPFYTKIFQILVCDFWQQIEIYAIFHKRFRVLGQPQIIQPRFDVTSHECTV
jgi:hypothetical protein